MGQMLAVGVSTERTHDLVEVLIVKGPVKVKGSRQYNWKAAKR